MEKVMKNFTDVNEHTIMDQLDNIWSASAEKVLRMMNQLEGKSPHVAKADGIYDDMPISWWTSGFWPGILWVMYDVTKNEEFKKAAWDWDKKLEQELLNIEEMHHDVGFQFLSTAVIKYKITGDLDAKRIGISAANYLAGRYNVNGNFIRAWNHKLQDKLPTTGWAIIDCMMNISLLFWASEETGDPRFKDIAINHADTVLKYFIREDGSVNHIVSFDPETGEFIEPIGGQGAGPSSSWSRGQAWAIYGLANTYRSTGDIRYLKASQKIANYFIACLPEDYVSCWDFRVDDLENEPKDSSATAIAASGMLELCTHLPSNEAHLYRKAAKRMIASLTKNYGTWDNEKHQAILTQGTGHKPANKDINVSLIYGDYYYIECLAKLIGWKQSIY